MALPRLEFAEGFESELLEAVAWYAEQSIAAANHFVDEVEQAIKQIQSHPERWPLLGRGIRKYLLNRFPYLIVYRVDRDCILIVAISHAARRSGY
jgi:plasmid stabilization system protein ParE